MTNYKLCIIPCNGLDKSLGIIARTVALKTIEKEPKIELICPVLLNNGEKKYEEILKSSKIVVVDGCMTGCATKLIEERNLKIFKKVFIPEMSKKFKLKPGKNLILTEEGINLAKTIATELIESLDRSDDEITIEYKEIEDIDYFDITVDKFYFRVPKSGFNFNENDCWIKPEGDLGLIGITDYLQNSASDIMFVELPEIGGKIEQFDDVGSFESVKTVLQLISPVSGEIVSINKLLEKQPELLNQDPYGKGWFAEIKLANFEEDKELLMDCSEYFEYMKNKIMKESEHLKKMKSEKND